MTETGESPNISTYIALYLTFDSIKDKISEFNKVECSGKKVEIRVEAEGVIKDFTLVEFLTMLGFDVK